MKKATVIRVVSIIAILSVGLFGMIFLSSAEKHSNKKEAKADVRTVQVTNLNYEDITLEIAGNGVIESQRTLSIISEATGKVLFAKNDLKNGTFVKKGEVIVKIDPREVENNLYSLRSDFLNSVALILPEMKIEDTKVYDKWYNYFENLEISSKIPDLPEIENSQEQIKVSSRNVFTKYYAVKNQEILLSKHEIFAPFDGYIESGFVIENSFVSRNQTLFTLHDVNNLEIAVPLIIGDVNFIEFSKNPSVTICSENREEKIEGNIFRKDTKLDKNSQSLNVYVTFNNSKLSSYFLPGNYVYVRIKGEKLKNVAKIPRHVIGNDNYIYTMSEGKLGRSKIDLLAMQDNSAIIGNTISPDTKIVTTILQKPLIGMNIQTLEEARQAELDKNVEKELEESSLASN
ncbi:MAG: efflux RND transporter periplasmic adaptor subunit [Melioribacteraceae bacterium]|nr:efflux RND transporter periplasmic adaptor subunit [Melioribacteraceae bacterium]